MFQTLMRIENLANDEVRSGILLRFSTAEKILPKGIQHKMTAVYDNKVIDESLARRWMRKFATDRETLCHRKRLHHHVRGAHERVSHFIANDRRIKRARLPPFCKISRVFVSITLYKKRWSKRKKIWAKKMMCMRRWLRELLASVWRKYTKTRITLPYVFE